MSKHYAMTVLWESPLQMDYNSGLSNIAGGIASKTGGRTNYITKNQETGRYRAVVYVPEMIIDYANLLGMDGFASQVVEPYYTEKYKMTNVEVRWAA